MISRKPVVVRRLNVIADQADCAGAMSSAHDGLIRLALGKERFVLDPAELDVLRPEEYEAVPQSRIMSHGSVAYEKAHGSILLHVPVDAGGLYLGDEMVEPHIAGRRRGQPRRFHA
jgi:hypothetical protein